MSKTGRKYGIISSSLIILAIVLLVVTGTSMAQDPAKPDIHLVFDVNEDGSNTVLLELAIHPLLDPLLRQGLDLLYEELSSSGKGKIEIIETTRDGRSYNTLSSKFDSLGDLNAFVNTPQMLSGLLGLFVPDATIPPVFSEFEITSGESLGRKTFHVNAVMDAGTTDILRFANFTIHARLPLDIEAHNAPTVRNNELSWPIEPGETLEMTATATDSMMLEMPTRGIILGNSYWVIGLVIVVVIVIAIVGYLLYRRSRRTDEDEWADW